MRNKRTCIATYKKLDKKKMIRIVKFQGVIMIEKKDKLPGRGSYICKDKGLITKLEQKKLLHKAFKMQVDYIFYKELIKILKEC